MNEVQFRRVGKPRPPHGAGEPRGNCWFVFPLTADAQYNYPGIEHPRNWTRRVIGGWFNLDIFDWRLVSSEGKILAEFLGWRRLEEVP